MLWTIAGGSPALIAASVTISLVVLGGACVATAGAAGGGGSGGLGAGGVYSSASIFATLSDWISMSPCAVLRRVTAPSVTWLSAWMRKPFWRTTYSPAEAVRVVKARDRSSFIGGRATKLV